MILTAVLIVTVILAVLDICKLESRVVDLEDEKDKYEKIIDLFSKRD